MAIHRTILFVITVFVITGISSSCSTCPSKQDLFAKITNTFDTDVTVVFQAINWNANSEQTDHVEYSEVVPAHVTREIFLYTYKYNYYEQPKFEWDCGKSYRGKHLEFVEFSKKTFSEYTICKNNVENEFVVTPINSSCPADETLVPPIGY